MPSFLAHENAKKVPSGALWLTNIVILVFLLVTYFAEYAFTLALKMTSSMTLIPYLLVAAYGLKLAWTGEPMQLTRVAAPSTGFAAQLLRFTRLA